jgi:hypothetical protein
MTARTIARPLALLAGVAILVAACGGGAASQAPATQAPATQGPAATGGVLGSFAIPSFHGDVDLENMLPSEIAGEAIERQSMTGEQFLGGGGSDEVTGILSGLSKTPSDLSVAFGGNAKISMIAFKIDGVPGGTILEAFKNASTGGATMTDVSLGGKSVKKITDENGDDSYGYGKDDVVFVVSGDDLTDALLNEAFSKLP